MDCHVREASVEWVVYMVHRYLRLNVLRLGTEEDRKRERRGDDEEIINKSINQSINQ